MSYEFAIFVQARMSSSRTPGKVLADINGKQMLVRQIQRLKNKFSNTPVICVTSDDADDDSIHEVCKINHFDCFRGSLNNVLDRFIEAAEHYRIKNIIRVGGDDPLIDVNACEAVIDGYNNSLADFVFTSHIKGWPFGSACELISLSALKQISKKTVSALYLEHIIPWFHHYPNEFKIKKINAPKEIYRPDYYFSVDYQEDLELIRNIFTELEPLGDYFQFIDVINLCDRYPNIINVNKHLHTGFEI
tara:strand:+ start:2201 stop:2941 length:741 start_codon:yes stop_codon:yes gene_type:complete